MKKIVKVGVLIELVENQVAVEPENNEIEEENVEETTE